MLGLELYFLGHLVEAGSHLLSISKPYMEQLRDQTGESATLNIIHQKKRKCIGYIEGKHLLTTLTFVGQYSPLYSGASAKVLLAFLPENIRNEWIDEMELEAVTEKTVLDKETLHNQLKEIREQGYAISYGERVVGAFSICAPIYNRLEEVIASISITVPAVRLEEAKIGIFLKFVLDCASNISGKLGHN
jgi:IclR family KDG regulon transcriptional repressor